jgi:hypothetical protein
MAAVLVVAQRAQVVAACVPLTQMAFATSELYRLLLSNCKGQGNARLSRGQSSISGLDDDHMVARGTRRRCPDDIGAVDCETRGDGGVRRSRP